MWLPPQTAALALFGLGVWVLAADWGEPPSEPAHVTTDTAEYCAELVVRAGAPSVPGLAALLAEGKRMCANGMVRPGLARVRQVLLEEQTSATRP